MSLLLTATERDRFALWLDNEIVSGEALVEQFEKLDSPATKALAMREKLEIHAAKVIVAKLRSIESQTISG